jgi:pimeloyl-ACP methyl ester carboxylesterase
MMPAPNAPLLDPRERHFTIDGPNEGLQLFLRHLAPTRPTHDKRVVLYVHGATFPSALSIAHRFDGVSWRDVLCEAGFDVWGLDFQGFGGSDRYPQMQKPAEASPPLCDTADAIRQVEAAVRFICADQHVANVSLIAHSWGSMPAAAFAAEHPASVDRLILFGPIAQRPARRYEQPPGAPAWRIVTPAAQWERFNEDVPAGESPAMERRHFDEWAKVYLDSDPQARMHDPQGVKTPTGPFAAILKAWHGQLGYDPGRVHTPVAIIRGEWDGLLPDADARWLFDAFAAPCKRDIKIAKTTHLMHLERMRHALHQESVAFLNATVN